MDRSKILILSNGKDITGDVKSCMYNKSTQKYDVTFQNGNTYNYNYNSIEWITEPHSLNPALVRIVHQERELFNIQTISVFYAKAMEYWFVCFSDGSGRTYERQNLKITYSCLIESASQNCMDYLRQLATVNELKSDDGEVLLQKQYEKLGFVSEDSVMAVYLNSQKYRIKSHSSDYLIFPFGGNASQFKAVNNALLNQVSVVQGPPGTGKTQTILNIIANLLIRNKTIQIVSNNNSATLNVLEKLSESKYNMDFLVAVLGNSDNKKAFIENQTGLLPDMFDWKMDSRQQSDLKTKIQNHVEEILKSFSVQERLAQARAELDSLTLEIKYFEQYCNESGLSHITVKSLNHLNSKGVMRLWQECSLISEKERAISLWFKIRNSFTHGIFDWNFYKNSLSTIITSLQNQFYQSRNAELVKEITQLEEYLKTAQAKEKLNELTDWSMMFLRAKLSERYGNKEERTQFAEKDLRKSPDTILQEYPIVLSTTFSSCSSLRGAMYDYLIMDEASQVDIATGALALSCSRNAVIVGDLKQLPNVITQDMKKRCDTIFASSQLHQGYSYSENSFLKSICEVLTDIPQTLLREHYRCHPKIIGFCNQKFYNNELIIMTQDHGEADTLSVHKTVVGNHNREHINQRQIDVIVNEALPLFNDANPNTIGIIAPYNKQVDAISQQLDTNLIEIATVHKFQGREKENILLSTVDDVVTDFSDDPYLLNVAVSRAKKRLSLVVSANEQPTDSNIGDLISYIEYNNFKIIQSKIRSVFDLLYRQYTDSRLAFLKKHSRISVYNSENIMYAEIVDILKIHSKLSLNVICHQPLGMLINDTSLINDEEHQYAKNPATHLDFLIYNTISKKPVLVIEVDGFDYHKPGTQQHERDKMKDRILERYGIPLLRFPTNGSGEREKIEQFLIDYVNNLL
ncbi:MAG: AAA domain-containing protein [Oscillospiraceae bacterium]|nr:AAA domain-containing protein [Oscillospiraceae bacterium]